MTRDEMFEIILGGAQRWANHLESCDNESVNKGHGKVYTLEIQMLDTAINEFRKAEEHRGQQTPIITPGLREPSLIPDEPRFLPDAPKGTPPDRFKDTTTKHIKMTNEDAANMPLPEAIALVDEWIDEAMTKSVVERNKMGVEIHNKVERLKSRAQAQNLDVDDPVRVELLRVTKKLLKEIFAIT